MEKEHQPDSMATINMKPDYPPSEVYSTSEPPPAYRQRVSSSVQIARIIALTVVASAFILGSFILASSWITARASCHQLEQLDAMLDKELALEGRAYGNDALLPEEPLPVANAHALKAEAPPNTLTAPQSHAVPSSQPEKDDVLNQAESKVDEDKLQKIDSKSQSANSDSEENSDSDSSDSDEEDLDSLRPMFKLPLQFDLDDLAGTFLANSQKGRMNCVVEKRQEEPMERRFPFNLLNALVPRPPQGEQRIAIICHGGDEQKPMVPEPQSQVFAFPLSGPVRLPIRPQPERDGPITMPEDRLPLSHFMQHRPPPLPFPFSMPWDSSEEHLPTPPREMRIQVQRVIAIPTNRDAQAPPQSLGPFIISPPRPQQESNENTPIVHQFVPQPAPTQEQEQHDVQKMENIPPMGLPWGLTPEDMQAIHRTAQDAVAAAASQQREQQIDNDMQEVKTIVNTLAAAAAEAEAEAEAQAEADARAQAQNEDQRQGEAEHPQQMMEGEQSARVPRTLLLPQDMSVEERPHYVQPRSVRGVDAL